MASNQFELLPKSLYCPANIKPSHRLNDPVNNPWANLSYPIQEPKVRTTYALCWAEARGTATPAGNYLKPTRALVTDQANCRLGMSYAHPQGANVVMGDGSARFVLYSKFQSVVDAIQPLYSSGTFDMSPYYLGLEAN